VQLRPDVAKVERCVPHRIRRPVEEVGRLASVLLALDEVVELEAELLRELAQLRVPLVDQLTAVLADLPVGEHTPNRPAASADPVRRLVHCGDTSRLPESIRGRQSREPRADHHNARRLGRPRR
jgi:hypothetical protein